MTSIEAIRPDMGTNIVALVEATPVIVLTDKAKFSAFYEAMKAECDMHVPDLTTEAGRNRTALLAYKVARTKTAIDDAGKKLNEEARARINAVDESRREIRQQLDALKDDVRKPLTEWETDEAARVDHCEQTLKLLRDSAVVGYEETAEEVRKRIAHVDRLTFEDAVFQGILPQAESLRASTITTLTTIAERMDAEEAQRAELERLLAEAADRARIDAEREAAAEAQRQLEAAEQAAAEAKTRAEAEQKAREEAARDADRAHRGKIMTDAKEAIMDAGTVDETTARAIVLAIAAGNFPNITIRF